MKNFIAYYSLGRSGNSQSFTTTAKDFEEAGKQLCAHLGRKRLPAGTSIRTEEFDRKLNPQKYA